MLAAAHLFQKVFHGELCQELFVLCSLLLLLKLDLLVLEFRHPSDVVGQFELGYQVVLGQLEWLTTPSLNLG